MSNPIIFKFHLLAIEHLLDCPYHLIESILFKCRPEQVLKIEAFNPLLTHDDAPIWRHFVLNEFKHDVDLETISEEENMNSDFWREMYFLKKEEHEQKLEAMSLKLRSMQTKKIEQSKNFLGSLVLAIY